MEIKTVKRGDEWNVVFKHGVQSFRLDYHVDTKEEAEWMKSMLSKCFDKAFGKQPTENDKDVYKPICIKGFEAKSHYCIECEKENNCNVKD